MKMNLKNLLKAILNFPPISKVITSIVPRNGIFPKAFRDRLANNVPVPISIVSIKASNGKTIRLHNDPGGIPKLLFWNGFAGYEEEATRFFIEKCRSARVVFDIGANIGYYSLLAASQGCQVFAFEPCPVLFERLDKNLNLNKKESERVFAFANAVGDQDGKVNLYMPRNSVLEETSILRGFREDVEVLEVECTQLDSFVRRNGIPAVDLVKIDIEGAEELAFRGMMEVLKNQGPDIICEVLPGRFTKGSEEILKSFGYQAAWIGPNGLVKTEKIIGDPTFCCLNFYFSKKL